MTASVQVALLACAVAIADLLLGRWLAPHRRIWLWALVPLRACLPPDLVPPLSFADFGVGASHFLDATVADAGACAVVLFGAWLGLLAGAMAFGCPLYWRARTRLLRSAVLAPASWQAAAVAAAHRLGLRSVPKVLQTDRRGSPCVVGCLRPVVIVPEPLASQLSATEREHVLLHEFAHVQRRDPWFATALLAVQLVFFFHPALWLAQRRIATLRELACDQRARSCAAPGGDYRATLQRCARQLLPVATAALGMLGLRRQITTRLLALQSGIRTGNGVQRILVTLAMALCCACCVPLAAPGLVSNFTKLEGCLQKRFAVLAALARAPAEPAR